MRQPSRGIGLLSALFCAAFCGSMIGACSASGNDPTIPGGGGVSDSGAAGDSAYNYGDSGSNLPNEDGSTTTPKDSGPVVPYDSGPTPTLADCDLSGAGVITYFTEAESGGDGACGAADACATGDCCMNFASIGIPPAFAALFSSASAPVCVAQ